MFQIIRHHLATRRTARARLQAIAIARHHLCHAAALASVGGNGAARAALRDALGACNAAGLRATRRDVFSAMNYCRAAAR